jgi:uncharacterized protein (TIGR03435 family)
VGGHVSGVTGSNLKKRIGGIMMNRIADRLDSGRKILHIAASTVALAGIIAVGVVPAPRLLRGAVPQSVSAARNGLQDESGPRSFDVVSVVVDHEGTGGAGDGFPKNGTWRWKRIPLSFLIRYAYDVSLKQIADIPNSFQGPETAFDIVAKMPADVTKGQFRMMLQSLLADRFKFVMHRETRDVPVNTIEVAKGGPKLQPATGQCVQAQQSATLPPDQHRCGEVALHFPPMQNGVNRQQYFGRSVSVGDLAAALSANGPVIDDTGIKGLYDIDVNIEMPLLPPSNDPDEKSNREFDYQRIFNAAFEKQLGLSIDLRKLKKRPVPVIVVDHVELPTPN